MGVATLIPAGFAPCLPHEYGSRRPSKPLIDDLYDLY
jgi:hypothetical protein